MSEVTRMYELLYEERWDEKKQKERRNEAAFFSPESPITREIPIEELFDVLDAGHIRRGTIRRHWCIAFLNRSSAVL